MSNEAAEVREKLAVANKRTQELEYSESQLKEARANMRALREEIVAVQAGSRGELRKVSFFLSIFLFSYWVYD